MTAGKGDEMARWARLAGLATAAVVGLQVLLPRIFSVVLWYHLGFFAVSLAMLGLAMGGVLVRRGVLQGRGVGGGMDTGALGGPASVLISLSLVIVVRLPLEPTSLLDNFFDPFLLFLMGILLAAPFVYLGTLICSCLDRGRESIGAVYAATFFGGALGAGLTLFCMDTIGAPRTAGVLAVLPLLAALPSLKRGVSLAALVLALALFLVPDALIPLKSRKHFPKVPPEDVISQEWNAFSHVTFYRNPERHGLWEMKGVDVDSLPPSIGVAIDEWAITSILDVDRAGGEMGFLDRYPPTLAYTGATDGFQALVIGAGGGVDVLGALRAGAGKVTAVEINPIIVSGVMDEFREFSGDLYRDSRVEPVVAEGRHFIQTTDELYDRIVLSGVDTFASTEAGAFALSENHLYTIEAIQEYYEHLKPGGVLAMTRWWFEPPRQTLRLVVTATEALANFGIENLNNRVFLAHVGFNSIFLLKKGEYTPTELAQLASASQLRAAEAVIPDPANRFPLFSKALTPEGAREVVARHPYRVDATTDDRPFFFENSYLTGLFASEGDWIHGRLGGQELLVVTLVSLLVLCLPLLLLGRSGGRIDREWVRTTLPFVAFGLAYLMVEVSLMQRLSLVLGHPVMAVAVVLVTMLVGSGVGSLISSRVPDEKLWAAATGASFAVLAVPLSSYPLLLQVVEGAPESERILAVISFLALPSFAMGLPFPIALRVLGKNRADLVPSAYAINGVASVVAGPVAVLLAMAHGFEVVLVAGAFFYLVAALVFRLTGD